MCHTPHVHQSSRPKLLQQVQSNLPKWPPLEEVIQLKFNHNIIRIKVINHCILKSGPLSQTLYKFSTIHHYTKDVAPSMEYRVWDILSIFHIEGMMM